MTKKRTDTDAEEAFPGFRNLDEAFKKALTASNKDVRQKMEAEKKARKRKRR